MVWPFPQYHLLFHNFHSGLLMVFEALRRKPKFCTARHDLLGVQYCRNELRDLYPDVYAPDYVVRRDTLSAQLHAHGKQAVFPATGGTFTDHFFRILYSLLFFHLGRLPLGRIHMLADAPQTLETFMAVCCYDASVSGTCLDRIPGYLCQNFRQGFQPGRTGIPESEECLQSPAAFKHLSRNHQHRNVCGASGTLPSCCSGSRILSETAAHTPRRKLHPDQALV